MELADNLQSFLFSAENKKAPIKELLSEGYSHSIVAGGLPEIS